MSIQRQRQESSLGLKHLSWVNREYRVSGMAVLIIVTIGTACGQSAGNDQQQQSPASNVKSYSNDGLLGTTRSNPNVPTFPTYHTYAEDFKMIEQSAREVRGVQEVGIILNGPSAVVTIKVDPQIPREERNNIRNEAQETISKAIPRYHVSVKLDTID